MNKRNFSKTGILILMALVSSVFVINTAFTAKVNQGEENPGFIQAPLPYAFNALEPHFDARTMEIHYARHHAAYVNNLNKALEGKSDINLPLETILSKISEYPTAVRNNGGGHYNHELFWNVLSPQGGGDPIGDLAEKIKSTFGSLEQMKDELNKAALGQFGSGWAWLIVQDGKLKITSTPNQDNPLMDVVAEKGYPILGVDVWEHAYYLKYQNRRGDYVSAFWNLVNWNYVNERYQQATKKGC
jgi:superoxide dismutase, Fe-Mn family